jgi:hypothetical protein
VSLNEAWGAHITYGIKPYINERINSALDQLQGYENDNPNNNGYVEPDNPDTTQNPDNSSGSTLVNNTNSIKIFPNPVKDGFFFIQSDSENAIIIVYDQLGKPISTNYVNIGNGEYRLNFNDLTVPGWYILKINNLVVKFIVQ